MTIPKNINREQILKAIQQINNEGVPQGRESTRFNLSYEKNLYPPKYVISIANIFANGVEHPPTMFSGGEESNRFLRGLGFTIIEDKGSKNNDNSTVRLELANPFLAIFKTASISDWAFDLMLDSAQKLDIESCSDERLGITLRKDKNAIHFNFCTWLLLGFEGLNNGTVDVRVPLFQDYLTSLDKNTYSLDFNFSQEPDEPKIVCCKFQMSELMNVGDRIWEEVDKALVHIKERFMNHKRSPFRNKHHPQICKAVFDKDYRLKILSDGISEQLTPEFWWVNQGQTHREEKEGGFIWAPLQTKSGQTLAHHKNLTRAKKGDIVFAYSTGEIKAIGIVTEEAVEHAKPSVFQTDNWQEEGNLVKLKYFDLHKPIRKEEIPLQSRIEEGGPFDRNGNVKQGYFFEVSEDFVQKLVNTFSDSIPSDLFEDLIKDDVSVSPDTYTYNQIITHIDSYIACKGFYYAKEEITNLFLSLKTKPFVILSGISGTGKTKIVQWFAESIGATERNGQFTLIPVRPDWNDGSDLLGYRDIKGGFAKGPLTKVLEKAKEHPNLPFIVLLDEMNLARVEYYFSDILSVMESRRWEDGEIVTSNLLSEDIAGQAITLPTNVYIIGTVNMDDTTHPFSKKVLDRANTIEFNEVNLGYLEFLSDLVEHPSIELSNNDLGGKYLTLKDVYKEYPDVIKRATDELVSLNEHLKEIGAHVGYRVRDEICFYLAYNEQGDLLSFEQAFDRCVMQKILPRISGSDDRVKKVLDNLFTFCTNQVFNEEAFDELPAKYPKSAKKIAEMRRRLLDDGYTSFWIGS